MLVLGGLSTPISTSFFEDSFSKIAISPCTAHIQVYVLLSTMNHSCAPSVRLDTSADSGAEAEAKTGMNYLNRSLRQLRFTLSDLFRKICASIDLEQFLRVAFLRSNISNIDCP